MGTLKPGATYIYEKADGVTYAREAGAPPHTRVEIGRDYYPDNEPKVMGVPIKKVAVWIDMIHAAETNPALHEAMQHAKILHLLSKEYGKTPHQQ